MNSELLELRITPYKNVCKILKYLYTIAHREISLKSIIIKVPGKYVRISSKSIRCNKQNNEQIHTISYPNIVDMIVIILF